MFGVLKKIFAFSGEKRPVLKRAILIAFVGAIFTALQFLALLLTLDMVVSGNKTSVGLITGILLFNADPSRKGASLKGRNQGIAHRTVIGAQPVYMTFVVAAFNKARQGQLIDGADGAGVEPQFAPKAICQCGRQNQIPDTKRRSKAFREGIGINHLPRCIDTLK